MKIKIDYQKVVSVFKKLRILRILLFQLTDEFQNVQRRMLDTH